MSPVSHLQSIQFGLGGDFRRTVLGPLSIYSRAVSTLPDCGTPFCLAYDREEFEKKSENIFADYAGATVAVENPQTGEVRPVQIFVAVLGASSYTYAEATWSGEKQGHKIGSRLTIHPTPKHGSWLNQAEIELSLYSRQCLAVGVSPTRRRSSGRRARGKVA